MKHCGMSPIFVILHDDGSQCKFEGICLEDELFGPIRGLQYQIGCTDGFQVVEELFFFYSPRPLSCLFCKIIKGACDVGEFGDKGPIEIAEAKEASDIFYGERHRPLSDALYFCWVHLYLSLSDDNPKVLDFFLVKLTFFRF